MAPKLTRLLVGDITPTHSLLWEDQSSTKQCADSIIQTKGLKEISIHTIMKGPKMTKRAEELYAFLPEASRAGEYAFLPEVDAGQPFKQTKRAFRGYTKSFEFGIISKMDPMIQMGGTRNDIGKLLLSELESMKGLKFTETLEMTFEKQLNQDESTYKTAYFNSKPNAITSEEQLNTELTLAGAFILRTIGVWISEGSGWVISSIDGHFLNVAKYKPLNGSSYAPLPKELQNPKKGLINLKNKDNECFRWCHVRYINPDEKDPQRVKKTDKKFVDNLDYSGVDFPVAAKHYNRVEKQNDISVSVFGYENGHPYPIYVSKECFENHMDLLLISGHYVLIKDFNQFMYNQTKHKERKNFCRYCLQCFRNPETLSNHINNCMTINGEQAIKMPDKTNNTLSYNGYQKQLNVPFVVYADFEAITEKVTSTPSDTEAYQKHTDCGYGYKVVCRYDDNYSKPVVSYRGEGAVNKFIHKMLEEANYCNDIRKNHFNKEIIMTKADKNDFTNSANCHICGVEYTSTDVKARDHCCVTGKYRGSAHQVCSRSFKLTDKLPVVFHNLRGYDSHFIMQEIGKFGLDINVIPNNMEKYMAFMLGKNLVFIDSFQFMSSGLDRLASNLPDNAFVFTGGQYSGEQLKLMKCKGVYPYDYMDSFDRFNDTQLPSKEQFYNILNDEHITDDQYKHAVNVWTSFGIKNMGEYHDLYLKCDILLLSDVFENFRKTCTHHYGLDPCHYFTSPGLAWDAMLKMTGIKLELMTDIDMFQFIEKGLRGGVSNIVKRYGTANNKYMANHNENDPTKYIMYLDANNLYGWAMSQRLPTGGFKWIKADGINLGKYDENSGKGLILEVDLEYPSNLHDEHNDYPVAPEKIAIKEEWLSNYCRRIKDKFNVSVGCVSKLVPNLMDKKNYVVHYRNLQLYTDLGLKVTKVHRVLEFDQSAWLKQYIDFNTVKRTAAKNAFEKEFFKLMNNSVFGKTMENLRKRVDVRLVTNNTQLLKLTSKPTFVSLKIFNKDLVAVHKVKEVLVLNRPAYVGMSILDLSKTLMYDFHYNYIRKKYSNAQLLFTDTDSLMYEITTNGDVYEEFLEDKHLFDNSDYYAGNAETYIKDCVELIQPSPFYFNENKKVIGKMKDECAGVPIVEFVGLRSKMYSYLKEGGKGDKKAKGIKKCVIKKTIKHENYRDVLFTGKQLKHTMKTIRSNKHQIGSYKINKISLSCFDDKRYLLDDGIESYAYGHEAIYTL